MINHGVVIFRLPSPRLAQARRLGMSAKVHMRRVCPDEERLSVLVRALDEIFCPATISSSIVYMRFLVSGPVFSIFCPPFSSAQQ